MSLAIKFLERVSRPIIDEFSDMVEDVSLSDAIYATKMANLELANKLNELETLNEIKATLEDIIRQAKKEHVKL